MNLLTNLAIALLTAAYIFGVAERTKEMFWYSGRQGGSMSEDWVRVCLLAVSAGAFALHLILVMGVYAPR